MKTKENNFGIKKDEDKNYRTINKFKLKKAENNDYGIIANMINQGAKAGEFNDNRDTNAEKLKDYIETNEYPNYEIFVFEKGNEIGGYLDISHSKGVGEILGIYVSENYRKQNLGTEMLNEIIKKFKKYGCYEIKADVYDSNNKSKAFFTKNGFEIVGSEIEEDTNRKLLFFSLDLSKFIRS
jgi:ribosomal protein S18 acetylase RimI-like enzyme